jgi:hypothetical protein
MLASATSPEPKTYPAGYVNIIVGHCDAKVKAYNNLLIDAETL